jgi:hypothetical protein
MEMLTNPITVAETLTFQRQAGDVWSYEEREAFIDFIARNPEAGDIIRDGGGSVKFGGVGRAREKAEVLVSFTFSTTSARRSICSWSMRRRYARTFRTT